MISVLALWIAVCGVCGFYYRRVLRYLRYFQQEEYNDKRFVDWLRRHRAFDRRGTVVCLGMAIGTALIQSVAGSLPALLGWLLGSGVLIWSAWREEDPRSTGKITLKITQRARRIWWLSCGLFAIATLLVSTPFFLPGLRSYASVFWLCLIPLIQATPLLLIAANRLLAPHERRVQKGFRDEAVALLGKVHPLVIGITGSYGKTSTKVVLATFMETAGPIFWPPGSINTEMGIVREIREHLKPGHRFAIIEMGAYGIGSIRKLCALTPPQAAIITCVGAMHLERFGSPEAIFQAKSELAQALPEDGLLVCNGDDPGARRVAAKYPKRQTYLYGFNPDDTELACWMSDLVVSATGTQFILHWQGQTYPGATPLLGKPMLSNMLAAFTLACALGAHPAALLAAARNLRPAAHRLEVRPQGATLMIDDTYNSNPVGFAEALDILKQVPGGRKRLVTPGMVELGAIQESENRRLAELAATICDQVVVVGDTNAKALLEGLRAGGASPEQIRHFAHREQARAFLDETVESGDVILWENDLPDLYEDQPRF
ncbi:MAG: UDP-N-acetylmuramoyl-tripeptide--D-alanyl-D-alanine ligase [Gammaproteobacteria bacterium]|nr:UDP-N-acetylmuramoyl-tripeptide--D-alanyl-D-alanine ligase [Gammaproteobacteria bacterium]MCP5423758.1 UDP-N-acetylmuramoyl-tripeptide--D-alanyl-D-alanine ligase [Gammaproteobacteria bacterium]